MKNVILLLVGVAVFLLGMSLMSRGLTKATGSKIKTLFSKLKNNRFAALGIGASTTAVIQSSAATSVMVLGFLNAGAITLFQGLAVVMGAYIGTTVTGLIVSISSLGGLSFDITLIFMLLAFVGMILSFFKNQLVKNIGEICSGLGLLFFGLYTLKNVFNVPEVLNITQNIFLTISNPLLLLIVGAFLTVIVQSSSASTGIMIVMVASNAIPLSSTIYVALGATVGTVITTIIASIGGNTNSKRLALISLIMRSALALIFVAILWPLDTNFLIIEKMSNLLGGVKYSGLFIAIFMVLYNIITMFMMLPFIEKLVKLGSKIVKDKEQQNLQNYVKYIDDNMLNNPSIALMQVEKEISNMNHLAFDNYKRGFNAIINGDLSEKEEIEKTETAIDFLNNKITDFLIKLSSITNEKESRIVGGYFHVINDVERIGDHAENFLDTAIKMKELNLQFSSTAKNELNEFNNVINQMFLLTFDNLDNPNEKIVKLIHEYEEESDTLKERVSTAHYQRITTGKCNVELSPFICNLVSELERIADHLTNIGYTYKNPTGDDE